MIMKLGSLFQIPSTKPVWNAPCRKNHDDVISGLQKTSLSRKKFIEDNKFPLITIRKSWSLFQNSSYAVGNKTSLSQKPGIADKTLLWITIMKSWSLSNLAITESEKSNMTASKPEVPISQIVDFIGTRFSRLYLCFWCPMRLPRMLCDLAGCGKSNMAPSRTRTGSTYILACRQGRSI